MDHTQRRRPPIFETVVIKSIALTPNMHRITLGGEGVQQLLLQEDADQPAAIVKILFDQEGDKFTGRAYTLRQIDKAAGTVDIDFVLHETGLACSWAKNAKPQQRIRVAGPRRGGFALLPDTQWLLLAGDATAIPALLSIMDSLKGTSVDLHVYIETTSQSDIQEEGYPINWLFAEGMREADICRALKSQLTQLELPAGNGQIWMAGESDNMRSIKRHFLDTHNFPKERLSAKGYWKVGEQDFHSH